MSDLTNDAPFQDKVRRGVGPVRHVLSVVIALVAVPPAYFALDQGTMEYSRRVQSLSDPGLSVDGAIWLAVGAGLLFLAAAAGRLAGSGPLIAAVVWGAIPAAIAVLKPEWIFDGVRELSKLHDQSGYWIAGSGAGVFAATGALLLGAAVAGRWRAAPSAATISGTPTTR